MWRTPVDIEASLLKICHNISPCHPYTTAVILLSWVLMEALWFHGSRFINLQNLINSHLKDSSPIGFDVSIKLWKILKQCKKVYGFSGTSYIKTKKDLTTPHLDFNTDGVIDHLPKLSIYYWVRKKYKDMRNF